MIAGCKFCGSTNIKTIPRPDTPHYAEYRCADCEKFNGWAKKPANEEAAALKQVESLLAYFESKITSGKYDERHAIAKKLLHRIETILNNPDIGVPSGMEVKNTWQGKQTKRQIQTNLLEMADFPPEE